MGYRKGEINNTYKKSHLFDKVRFHLFKNTRIQPDTFDAD